MLIFSGRKSKSNQTLIEEMLLKNYQRYYRLAYGYTHTAEDAADIVQNGAYKALKSHQSLKQPEFVETWLYRIMLNECFSYLRQDTRLRKHISYEQIVDENSFTVGNPEDHSENHDERMDLQKAIDQLSEQDKAIIMLKYFEDKTLEEIARILDENVNTVKSRLYRSLKKLQKYLSVENEAENTEKGR